MRRQEGKTKNLGGEEQGFIFLYTERITWKTREIFNVTSFRDLYFTRAYDK